jgi:SNF2 family DNA or RNA helicase
MAVLPELPDKILSTRRIPLTPAQTKAYNQMVKNMMAELKSGILMATDPLTLLGRLRYVASAMPEVNEDLDVISLSTPSNKLNEVKDILEGGSGQLVVYGESRKLMELLQEELWRSYSVGMITGAVPVRVRQGYVDMFQRGELDIMLATTGAGAEGITLTAANRMVVVQESWSNVANKQAHDRIHRIGQDRGTEIITLISEGTVDEAVHRATVEKEGQLQALVRDPEWLMAAARGDL